MSAKLVFLAGLLGVGGFAGYKMVNYDPALVPYSREQVQEMLVKAKTTLPRRDGPGEITIWSTGRTSHGVALSMQYAKWAPVLNCEAIVTPVSATESRVVADCGKSGSSGSAIADTQDKLRAPMFEEHIQATLNQREFDRSRVDGKEAAVVLQNLGGMQREALKRSDEAQQMQAESENRTQLSGDWGGQNASSSQPSGGWGSQNDGSKTPPTWGSDPDQRSDKGNEWRRSAGVGLACC